MRARVRIAMAACLLLADRCADVVYSATFEKGSGDIRARFRSIGGEWRVLAFHVNSPEFLKDPPTMACPHCGEACPKAAKFCPSCGKPVAGQGTTEPEAKEDEL